MRFSIVADRQGKTLTNIVHAHINEESVIVQYAWKRYSRLGRQELTHETVNHSLNYIDPQMG